MMDAFGERQQELLKLLFKNKQGMTVDDLADAVAITRTAIRQHLATLERTGYVERGELLATGGRPGQIYQLTEKGEDLFPKQYSWFSELLIEAIRKEKGSAGLGEWMSQLGKTVSAGLQGRLEGKNDEERVQEVVKVMNELAYQAQASGTSIEATNCVYHTLAKRYPEICRFDLALLGDLTNSQVDHQKCIVRGDSVCRFQLHKKK